MQSLDKTNKKMMYRNIVVDIYLICIRIKKIQDLDQILVYRRVVGVLTLFPLYISTNHLLWFKATTVHKY